MGYMRDATGRRLDSFEVADVDQIVDVEVARGTALLARLAPAETPAVGEVTADTPTITWGTSATITDRLIGAHSPALTTIGFRPVWDSVNARTQTTGLSGLDFFLTGDQCEIQFITPAGTLNRQWRLFVDGKPHSASVGSTSLTGNTTYYFKAVFGSAKTRRIEFHIENTAGWYGVRVPYSALVAPAARRPVALFVGDSYWSGSDASGALESGAYLLSRLLGVECVLNAFGGTGYVDVGVFGTGYNFGGATRLAVQVAADPEFILVQGSVNDDDQDATAVGTAAAAYYAALATALPHAKVIVFGPQPSNATDTVSATRQTRNAAVKAAALAAPNVLAFHDMIGNAGGATSAWSSGGSYAPDTLVHDRGSVWRWSNGDATGNSGGGTRPGNNFRWQLVTYAYTGTGRVGSTTGDGTRDFYLYSDNIHPMPAGSLALATVEVALIREDLRTAALNV